MGRNIFLAIYLTVFKSSIFLTVFIFFISGSCHNEFSGNKGKAAKNPRLVQHQYPIFIFYPKDRRGIQYNGPISVQSILEFLILARKPASHLGLKNDLVNLRANHGNAHMYKYLRDHSSITSANFWPFLDPPILSADVSIYIRSDILLFNE